MRNAVPQRVSLGGEGEFPDLDTVRSALSLAVRAPSVHNSQPWRWRVGEQSLHLYCDSASQLMHTDPDRRELLVSCGAALHHAVCALAALGWRSDVIRFPNPADSNHLASLTLSPCEPDEVDIALAAAISRRRADRRPFSDWSVPRADIATIGIRTAGMGVHVRRVAATSALDAIVALAVRRHLADDDYARELATWSGRHASNLGVPARNVPHPDPHAAFSGRAFVGGVLESPVTAYHGVIVALGTDADDEVSRLRSGEATSVALLTCTALGLASCPVS